ncbi:molybdopterin-dependent oxidoreductase [Nonomuraea sp. NBC_01738]|uniref:molybdopterin-dependent oxidoreductase n=1 Tax=Nonomuraea sp. NBC_01738 TaxID=2976003 RepID=UPI002E13E031|nr:molybdopterin-dependent oxidoreductase [Nonomuraea sp. NBC_01738]
MIPRFTSTLRSPQIAAKLGLWLGVSFTVSFATGLFSHFLQHPPIWLTWPSRPVNLYRVTQGLHVIGGIATVPLLLAKLWAVYPKLWQWPPLRSAAHGLERVFVLALVGGALFQLVTGLLNIAYIYPWPFGFLQAHYWTAYLVFGALVIHVVNEWAKVRQSAWTRVDTKERRTFLRTVAAACGLAALVTVGETVRPLAPLAVLAPRDPRVGPQGLPVNRSAAAAGVPYSAGYRLVVTGKVRTPLSLTHADLLRLRQHTIRLPIACVEGWSADGEWTGVRLRDLLALAGVAPDALVTVESLERVGYYRSSEIRPAHWNDPLALLALRLNGQILHLDHGFPVRLIAPGRPGVLQTKWISEVRVS